MTRLGIDIGGTGIKGALVDTHSGELIGERIRLVTPQPATPEAVTACIVAIARHFDWSGPIGCGFPAAVRNGVARTAANIDPAWVGIDVAQLLSTALSCRVRVCNDADAAGLAEMHFGAGRDRRGTVILITIGTGLGTALFSNGTLVPNTELGHLHLKGKIAEKYASAAAKQRQGLSYRKWAKRFDLYLKRIEELFWPDLIIVGGEVSKKHEQFFPYLTIDTEIVPAQLRNDAGIVGAALAVDE